MGGVPPVGPTTSAPLGETPKDDVALLKETISAISRSLKDLTYPNANDPANMKRLANLLITAHRLAKKITQGG